MNKIVTNIKNDFNLNPDLIIKTISINRLNIIYIVFIESICNSDKVNEFILKPLISNKKSLKKDLYSFIAGPNTIVVNSYNDISKYLTNGFTIVIFKNNVYAIETKENLSRSITESEVQTSLNGPKDSFLENYQTNIGLIKRRIKTNNLKIINKSIGRITNTQIGIIYIDNIANINIVNTIIKKIEKIDIDGIVDSSTLAYLIDGENKTTFPTVKYSERPDEVVQELLRGKVAIVVDTSPFVLILPAFFIDFINPDIDNYNKSINVNFTKILRIFAFIMAILTPALYNAILCFNPEVVPLDLLINFSIQRQGVPFPLLVEIFIMLIICEILKESDLRYPAKYGAAVSILGAIVLGQAAVEAGIVSSAVIIIVAITFIASLAFNDVEISNSIRYWTYLFLFISSFLGLYGIFILLIIFLLKICSIESIGFPYFTPITPYDKFYFNNTFIKKEVKNNLYRSNILTKNIKKGNINND